MQRMGSREVDVEPLVRRGCSLPLQSVRTGASERTAVVARESSRTMVSAGRQLFTLGYILVHRSEDENDIRTSHMI